MNLKNLIRAALLLALAIVFQSLRLMIPIPPFLTTFLIGSLVNACLLLTVELIGPGPAVLIAIITPFIAYFQQMLPLPVFILPVALGNSLFVLVYYAVRRQKILVQIGLAAVVKCMVLYGSFVWLLSLLTLPPFFVHGILFVMSWPQLVTGLLGGFLTMLVRRRFPFKNEKNSGS